MTRTRPAGGIAAAFPASRAAAYATVAVWTGIAATVAAVVVLRVGDTGWLPPLLVGAGVAMAVAAAADPLLTGLDRAPGRACVRALPRRSSRPRGRPVARSPRQRPRTLRP